MKKISLKSFCLALAASIDYSSVNSVSLAKDYIRK